MSAKDQQEPLLGEAVHSQGGEQAQDPRTHLTGGL